MKLVTFINFAYADICYNLYLQLKKFSRHTDLIIFCTDENTYKSMASKNLDCDVRQYKPVVFADISDKLQRHLGNTEFAATYKRSESYSVYQFLKHDVVYQTLLENERVCLIDADLIVFEDFVDELIYWMDNENKFYHTGPAVFGFKYYLQIKTGVDPLNPQTLYHWIGREKTINTGFMYVRQSDCAFNHIQSYSKLFLPHFDHANNLDEFIMTEYFEHINDNTVDIKDQINLLSDVGVNYTYEQVLRIKPKTYHPTFTGDKIEFMKNCNQWLVE